MYMIGTLATPYIVPKWVEARVTLLTCSVGLSLTVLLIGPVFEQKNLPVMLIGLLTSGSFLGPMIIPNMAEMMHAVAITFPDSDLEHANSLLSGILNCCYGLGQASGPLLGAALYQVVGFRAMCDIVAAIVFFFALLYFICA